jgi:DNA topoisomerase I
MSKNLVIVESPAKAKTIEKFLGKDFTVKSSFGHVRDLSKKHLGVDIENGFKPNYVDAEDKKKVIAELKKLSKSAETVWLATDEDREGEAISWHLFETLGLKDETTKRIVFHEITKPAILKAVNEPRSIDRNLVDAQQARRVLDRLVGFELSPVLWRKVKPALSAGRVQSVAVRLVVEREDEIKNFEITPFYKISADFDVKSDNFSGLLKAELPTRLKTKKEALDFLNKCIGASFSVASIEKKPAQKSPAPPFTTSTLQQEASRKLGFGVAKTMLIAQQLYEAGWITYMRTDSVNLSDIALASAKNQIIGLYGEKYHKYRKFSTKTKGAQEAHEAIRPSYLDREEISGTGDQQKLYSLIWKRTIASQMSNAQLERTTVSIDISTTKEKLTAKGEVLLFDGFLKVYLESGDDENNSGETSEVLPPLSVSQVLSLIKMDATERFTQPPARYSEAGLVKKLEELGIGRPSTYAPIISTIQKREYVVKSDKDGANRVYNIITLKKDKIAERQKTEKTGQIKGRFIPTDIGIVVNSFLMQYFKNILDYNFTAKVEKEFDEIAMGQKVWNKMIENFYNPFHRLVEDTIENSEKFSGEKLLGVDPESGKSVFAKIGRYGPMIQIGETDSEEKPRFASLKKGQSLETISLDEALKLFDFPRNIGTYEDADMNVAIGRFGPYVRHKSSFYSIGKTDDPVTIGAERAIEIIEEKRKKDRERTIKIFEEDETVKILNGRWGPYIAAGKSNIKIPKGKEPAELSFEEVKIIIEAAGGDKQKKAPAKKRAAKTKK